jgi:hypothetical protein
MLPAILSIVIAALFTGAEIYINIAEQPARLGLDDRALLAQWKPSYARGFTLQATLAILGGVAGIAAYIHDGSWLWILGAVLMLANWPYTLFVIMPVNRKLTAIAPDQAGSDSRNLILKWGGLHAVRSGLGGLAVVVFVVALLNA